VSSPESQSWKWLESHFVRKPLMTFIHSFFDESGKFKDKRVISLAGVCGSGNSLEQFNDKWNHLLRHNKMDCLHMQQALRQNAPLSPTIRKQTVNERIEALKPFASCIADNLNLGIGMVVEVEEYKNWSREAKRKVGGSEDPAYVAFIRTLMEISDYFGEDSRISIVCDHDNQTAWNFLEIYKRLKHLFPKYRKSLIAITFADDNHFPALQAADMISSLLRLEASRLSGIHPFDFLPLYEHLTMKRDNASMDWKITFGHKNKMKTLGSHLERNHG
jgi:hypothetical protein